jgi:(R,R)-butanediol dehydrogenase/meso-butanediol dehydrogenase/diacetyl reductase
MTMRAAVFYGPRDLRLESVPEPQPGPGDVKLRVLYNGICGSDLHEYYDGPVTTRTTPHPLTGVRNPVILGHELCGEVDRRRLGSRLHRLSLAGFAARRVIRCGGLPAALRLAAL